VILLLNKRKGSPSVNKLRLTPKLMTPKLIDTMRLVYSSQNATPSVAGIETTPATLQSLRPMTSKTDAQSQLDELTCRWLGEFVVAFSGLLYSLETSTVQLLNLPLDGKTNLLIRAALADRTSNPITSAFFSVFFQRWGGDLTAEDAKLLKHLRKEVDAIGTLRNRLMHDVWMHTSVGGEIGPHNLTRHRVRAHGTGAEYESSDCSPQHLQELTKDIHRLSSVVNASVWYHRDGQIGPELSRRLHVVNGKLTHKQNP
jgi:hypothetical protein